MKDGYNNEDICQVLDPASGTATVTSSPVDVSKYNAATAVFVFGECADTLSGSLYYTCTLTECDTYNGSFTAVAAADQIGDDIVVDAPADDDKSHRIGYIGNKNYIKLVATLTGTNGGGTVIGGLVILGHPRMAKATQASVAVATA